MLWASGHHNRSLLGSPTAHVPCKIDISLGISQEGAQKAPMPLPFTHQQRLPHDIASTFKLKEHTVSKRGEALRSEAKYLLQVGRVRSSCSFYPSQERFASFS